MNQADVNAIKTPTEDRSVEDLAGRIAMVTGGATGIGAAIVERFFACDADVACCYNKSRTAAEALARKLGHGTRRLFTVQADVTESEQVQSAVESIVRHFGRPISVLVNNAGDQIETVPVADMAEELWDRVMAINLKGVFLCSKYCIPHLKAAEHGRIINVSSISAHTGGGPGAAHYAASKGGVEALTRAMAKELGQYNITVNAVAPGVVYTALHQRFNTPESLERIRQNIPLARLGAAEEVASVVSFLASVDSSYITGEVIAINGGLRMD